jgi:IS5 family transposase
LPRPPTDAVIDDVPDSLYANRLSFSDLQMEDALYEIESIRRFASFNNVTENLPDETTIFHFRHLLEKH